MLIMCCAKTEAYSWCTTINLCKCWWIIHYVWSTVSQMEEIIPVMIVARLFDIQCQIKVAQNWTSRSGILSQELKLLLNISYAIIAHISHRWLRWNDVILSKKWCVDHLQEPINQAANWKISKLSNYHQDLLFTIRLKLTAVILMGREGKIIITL